MIPSEFETPPLLGNAHVQTLLARALRARSPTRYDRVRIDTPDGDFLDLDVWREPSPTSAACLLLHGLEGCAASGYIVSTCEALARRGVRPVALNFRSCSGEPNRTPGSYHSGRTDDIRTALRWMAARFAGAQIGVVGFSLGGNALINLVGGGGGESGLACGVAVSVPYDLAACADALERGPGRGYATYFMRSLRAKAREKATRFPDRVPAAAARARTVREFDDLLTAPVHGFRDADDYYARCSSGRFLGDVTLPMLLVQSVDDPLVPAASLPLAAMRGRPNLTLALTKRGGHVGFLDRRLGVGPEGWLEQTISGYIAVRAGASTSAGTPTRAARRNRPAATGHSGAARRNP